MVVGVDEVGRGAWAGPVTVGAVAVDVSTRRPPVGVRDSKMLSPDARARLVPRIEAWCTRWSLGSASAREIDEYGIMKALAVAASRAVAGLGDDVSAVLLDGNHDFLSPHDVPYGPTSEIQVVTIVRGDRACASVAAASILAKVARDAEMVTMGRADAHYGFEVHKGYGTHGHAAAIRERGITRHHRASWSIPCAEVETAPQ
jgi:ribonuclease HII